MGRRLVGDERRDLPQGRLLGRELASALLYALEHMAMRRAGVTWRRSADEIGLALPQRLGDGERAVVQGDLAAAPGNVEWLRERRVVADKQVALSVDEQVGALRDEIVVATPKAGVMVPPALQ